jgi:two-component system cell cycle response regulator
VVNPGESDDSPSFEADTLEITVRSSGLSFPPRQAQPPERPLLLRMDGINAGQVKAIESTPFTIGRHPSNALCIDDESISRFHAHIVREQGVYYLEDLGSRNGTFWQGQPTKRARLQDDEWIQFGARAGFRFSLTDARQERLMQKLYESSTRDALTGVYNRVYFEERLRTELAFAGRHSTELSLVLLDIDHFKRVNDTWGHQAGDAVLKSVAGACQRTLRTEDVFARFGGEEFAAILRGIGLAGAARLGERLRATTQAARTEFEQTTLAVTLSIGCAALSCCSRRSAEELIAHADKRLYAAKAQGRNRVVAAG